MRYTLARHWASVWRLRSLPLAERVFSDVHPNTILSRPFLGSNLCLDVSRTNTHKMLYLEGSRFIDERTLVMNMIGSGDCVVDVGANIGYYMLMFKSAVGENGKVICLEPEPDNIRELKANISGNNLSNVRLIEVAVGEESGTTKFACGINGMVANDGEITVRVEPLDAVCNHQIDLIKIDVEGYEGHVLNGAKRIIETYRPKLFVELHPQFLTPKYSIADIREFTARYYEDIQFYETPESSIITKVAAKYFGRSRVRRIDNEKQLLADCERGRKVGTFWMVCKP